jgi:four helix bundle protein
MKIEIFEDIIAWQKARGLALDVYRRMRNCNDFGYKNQLCRAVISISNNIAEGFERRGDKTFKQYLFIAKGSCGEVRSLLSLAAPLGHIAKPDAENLFDRAMEISRILSGLIKKLG